MADVHSSTGAPSRASSTPEININRRALVAGLSATPALALPALAAPSAPDPVFAALADERAAYAAWNAASDAEEAALDDWRLVSANLPDFVRIEVDGRRLRGGLHSVECVQDGDDLLPLLGAVEAFVAGGANV